MKGYILFRLKRLVVALGLVGAAFVLRLLLDPLLGNHLPFTLFLIAGVMAAWLTDVVEAVLVLGLGWLVANWFFEEPRHSLAMHSVQEWLRTFSYWFIGLAIVWFARARQTARLRELTASVELRRQEANVASYRALFDQAPVGLAVVDAASGLFLQANPGVCQLTGYTEAELLQKRIWELTCPLHDSSDWPSLRARLTKTSVGHDTETTCACKGGKVVRVSLRAKVAPAADKRGERLVCVWEQMVPQPETETAGAR